MSINREIWPSRSRSNSSAGRHALDLEALLSDRVTTTVRCAEGSSLRKVRGIRHATLFLAAEGKCRGTAPTAAQWRPRFRWGLIADSLRRRPGPKGLNNPIEQKVTAERGNVGVTSGGVAAETGCDRRAADGQGGFDAFGHAARRSHSVAVAAPEVVGALVERRDVGERVRCPPVSGPGQRGARRRRVSPILRHIP